MGLIPQTLSQSVERYGLGHIRPRHIEMARRLVLGQPPIEVSRSMGINIGRLSIIINSPLFKIVLAKLSKLRDESMMDITNELKELAPIALNEIAKVVMTSPSEKLRLCASQDILDRAGVIKKGQGINVGIQVNFDPVDINKYRVIPESIIVVNGEADYTLAKHGQSEESYVHSLNTSISSELEDMKLLDETLINDVYEVKGD